MIAETETCRQYNVIEGERDREHLGEEGRRRREKGGGEREQESRAGQIL
jgi:hypothetical protein